MKVDTDPLQTGESAMKYHSLLVRPITKLGQINESGHAYYHYTTIANISEVGIRRFKHGFS